MGDDMKYAIGMWISGITVAILCMWIDCDFTILEKVKFILFCGCLLVLIIVAASLLAGEI